MLAAVESDVVVVVPDDRVDNSRDFEEVTIAAVTEAVEVVDV